MKNLIFILLLLVWFPVFSQNEFTMGITTNRYNFNTQKSSDLGIGFAFSLGHIYFDMSGNGAKGKGVFMQQSSTLSYPIYKVSASSYNLGYVIETGGLDIIPVLGWAKTADIYEDPVSYASYYQIKKEHVNIGVNGRLSLNKGVYVSAGYSTFEGFKVGVSINLFKMNSGNHGSGRYNSNRYNAERNNPNRYNSERNNSTRMRNSRTYNQ